MKTIKVLAGAWEDGWAFVEKDNNIFLIRPPYHQEDKSEIEEATLKSDPAQQKPELKEKISQMLSECIE